MNYAGLLQSALVALLRNKKRSILTVLGITIGIAAVICVVAIGKAGQARVAQQLNNLGDNFVWIEAGGCEQDAHHSLDCHRFRFVDRACTRTGPAELLSPDIAQQTDGGPQRSPVVKRQPANHSH